MTAQIGQRVTYRTSSTRTVPALITHIVIGDQVNLVGLVDSDTAWPSGPDAVIHPANLFLGVDKGTGVGQWQECDVEPGTTSAIAAATSGYATESYADSAAASAVSGLASTSYVDGAISTATSGLATTSAMNSGDAGRCAVPSASSTASLASGTPRQPSTTRPVLVMISGSWNWNLTAIGTQTGSLTVKSDSAPTPTTVIRAPAWSRGVGVGVTISDTGTLPIEFDLLVRPGDYYSVTAAGGATFTIREVTL